MIKHFFRIVLRVIMRNRMVTTLNIAGLAAGLVCFILIYLLITDELKYDRFHVKSPQLYRIYEKQTGGDGSIFETPMTPTPLADYLTAKHNEVAAACRFVGFWQDVLVESGEQRFFETDGLYADPTFLTMLTFPLEQGDPQTALSEPSSMVVTRQFAEKYFGNKEAMGQTVRVNSSQVFKVSGIISEVPRQSSLQFSFIIPFTEHPLFKVHREGWGNNWHFTLLELKPGLNPDQVASQIRGAVKANSEKSIVDLAIQPMSDIRLRTAFNNRTPGMVRIYVFGLIAVLVLLTAVINFVNLSTAHATQRGKEVGMRKISGAGRRVLILQYLGEAILFAMIGFGLALLCTELALPFFNTLAEKKVRLSDLDGATWSGLGVVVLLTGIAAGLYPALVLSSMRPVDVLKGGKVRGLERGGLRKILVTAQFAISILLIIGTLIVYRQLEFMRGMDLGYDRENLVVVPLRGETKSYYKLWKSEVGRVPGVIGASASGHPIHQFGSNTWDVKWPGKLDNEKVLTTVTTADEDFWQVAGLQVVAGKSFDRGSPADSNKIIINERTASVMKLDHPVGTELKFWGDSYVVAAVVKDFHYLSVHRNIPPLIMMFPSSDDDLRYGIIRIAGDQTSEVISKLEEIWNRVNPAFPFDYRFLDEDLDRLYSLESTIARLFTAFCSLAILISCIGLFGLASHTAIRRTKEIGIRKVLGATVMQIIYTLNVDFIKLVLLANLVAWPTAYYLVGDWLQTFPHRISISPFSFILAGVASLTISVLVVSYHAVRSAVANPVRSLRYE